MKGSLSLCGIGAALRARLQPMTDAAINSFGQAARYMCSPGR